MSVDASKQDLLIGVVGAGAMGRGIAQVAVTGGVSVRLFDVNADQMAEAAAFIENMLGRAAEKGRMTGDEVKAAMGRLQTVTDQKDLAPCEVVIEAATENLDLKKKIFGQLEEVVAEDAIIATNTSSLSVTTIASACERPQRVAGFHFFNPVPLMRLVEVIDGVLTESWVGDALMILAKRMTREPVRLNDVPGFLVNQVGRGYNIESQHIQAEGVGDYVDFDRILREGAGFRMGPFELLDLTALDVTHPATELIYNQYYQEPRFRPSYIMRARYEAGILGRKVGKGYYEYKDGKQVTPEEAPAPDYDGRKVWVSAVEAEGHRALTDIVQSAGAPLDRGDTPAADSLILVTPIGDDVTTAAVAQGLDPERTLGVDTLVGLKTRRTIATNPATKAKFRDSAHGLLTQDGVPATVIRDCPAFVGQRVFSTICNIGCQIAQFGTASPEDIDKAVVLGLNFPNGPLQFGEVLGPRNVLRILDSLYRFYGDPRYRASPWLRRRAMLGISLLTTEI